MTVYCAKCLAHSARLAESNGWFPNASGLRKASRFTTVQLAAIAHDESQDLGTTGRVLAEVVGVSEQEVQHDIRRQAKEICLLVARRSAYMTAAAISGILLHQARAGVTSPRDGSQQSGGPRNIVAIDGGIFAKFGVYSSLVLEGVRQTLGAQLADQLELKMTPGGAGLGAACLAAAAHNYAVTMGHDTAPAPARRWESIWGATTSASNYDQIMYGFLKMPVLQVPTQTDGLYDHTLGARLTWRFLHVCICACLYLMAAPHTVI